MKNFKIYLAGAMAGESPQKARVNRDRIKKLLIDNSHYYEYKYELDICNPCDYYNFEKNSKKLYDSQREVKQFDLWNVRTSNLIIVDFINNHSIGTSCELTLAEELRIPIIGLNQDGIKLHSWDKVAVNKMFFDHESLCNYVMNWYLV